MASILQTIFSKDLVNSKPYIEVYIEVPSLSLDFLICVEAHH